MTGAGAPGAAGIIRCLRADARIDLILCDAHEHAVGRYLHGDFHLIPPASDAGFYQAIKSLCLKEKVDILMPLVTRELFILSQHKDELQVNGTRVLVSDENALSVANDKGRLYTHLQQAGIVVPGFRIVNSAEEFKEAAIALGYPGKRICFKPCISNGSRGFRIIDPAADEFDLLFNEKPNSTYMSFDKAIDILSGREIPQLIVSEYLPGLEYSVDCIADSGETLIAVPRKRMKMKEGISVEGEFMQDQELIEYCRQIIKSIHLHGNIGIQVKQAEDGSFKILEINPRVQGTIVAGLGAGINLPLLAIKKEMGWPVDPAELHVKWGTRFIRYWEEVYY